MNNQKGDLMEVLTLIINFLDENMFGLIFIVFIVTFRKSISSIFTRLTKFNYKGVSSEIGIEAASHNEKEEMKTELKSSPKDVATIEDSEEAIGTKVKENNWIKEMFTAFDEGRIDDAKGMFVNYSKEETDSLILEEYKAIYLYLLFDKGKDNSAISKLFDLAENSINEELKYSSLLWLSYCLQDGSQIDKEIELWERAIQEFSEGGLKTNIYANLAKVYLKNDEPNRAKKLLIKYLPTVEMDSCKAKIYSTLADIEKYLGNKQLSIFCKDKSLEYDPNNRDELFNTAYAASNENIDDITISNYLTLLRLDKGNDMAVNNLGAYAQGLDLNIIAVEKYKVSSESKNTLSMANQGNLLLNAGFIVEAERIAKEALKFEDVHQNVYTLLSQIDKKKEAEKEKWEEFSSNSYKRQKQIRNYTEQFYLGESHSLLGTWILKNGEKVDFILTDGLLKASWVDSSPSLGTMSYEEELIGEVSGSTFKGKYTKFSKGGIKTTLLGYSNKEIACFGFLSEHDGSLIIIPKGNEDDFSLSLHRENA